MGKYVVYTDGSYKKSLKLGASAFVIFKDDQEIDRHASVFSDEETLVAWNVGPELMACRMAINDILLHEMKEGCFTPDLEIDIYHDYVGVADWATGKWKKTQHNFAKEYVKYIKSLPGNVHLNFHKVKGHSGNKYNDLVDSLCKKAYKEYEENKND